MNESIRRFDQLLTLVAAPFLTLRLFRKSEGLLIFASLCMAAIFVIHIKVMADEIGSYHYWNPFKSTNSLIKEVQTSEE